MKLWEIKAQALRLMFADTDIEFSFAEFENGSIYENANTREKLVRMNDSIKRAIDLYYHYHGEKIHTKIVNVVQDEYPVDDKVAVFQKLNLAGNEDVVRIDLLYKGELDEDTLFLQKEILNAPFYYDENNNLCLEHLLRFPERYIARIWYKKERLFLPEYIDELVYDLNDLELPEEIQRKIPFYIKGELYEEDEPSVAQQAKSEYITFVITFKRHSSPHKQTRVRSNFKWR